jgi:hypothetical protein
VVYAAILGVAKYCNFDLTILIWVRTKNCPLFKFRSVRGAQQDIDPVPRRQAMAPLCRGRTRDLIKRRTIFYWGMSGVLKLAIRHGQVRPAQQLACQPGRSELLCRRVSGEHSQE